MPRGGRQDVTDQSKVRTIRCIEKAMIDGRPVQCTETVTGTPQEIGRRHNRCEQHQPKAS